jgi:hypothetical protein
MSVSHFPGTLKELYDKLDQMQEGASAEAKSTILDAASEAVSGYLDGPGPKDSERDLLVKTAQLVSKSKPQNVQMQVAARLFSPGEPVSAKLLLNITGDEFGAGSKLEGANGEEVLKYFYDYLVRNTEKLGIQPEIIEKIKDSLIIAQAFKLGSSSAKINYARKFIEKQLDLGRSVLIPAGWTGNPIGHAMFYELLPQKDGSISMRVFNLGGGALKEQQPFLMGTKPKVVPYTEWQGIAKEKILDPSFFQILHELKTLESVQNEKTQYGANDIYQALKEFLEPKSTVAPEPSDVIPLKMLQRAGTCTCRSLLAWFVTKCSKSTFKRFRLQIGVDALSDFVREQQDLGVIGRNLVSKSVAKLARKSVKALDSGIIDVDMQKEITTQLADAKSSLDKPLVQAPKVPSSLSYSDPCETVSLEVENVLLVNRNTDIVSALNAEKQCAVFAELRSIMVPHPKLEDIGKVAKSLERALEEGHCESIDLALFEWMPKISIRALAKEFEGHPEQAKIAIQMLGSISNTYFTNAFAISRAEVRDSKRLYISHKLTIACNTLAGFAYEGFLGLTTNSPTIASLAVRKDIYNETDIRVEDKHDLLFQRCAFAEEKDFTNLLRTEYSWLMSVFHRQCKYTQKEDYFDGAGTHREWCVDGVVPVAFPRFSISDNTCRVSTHGGTSSDKQSFYNILREVNAGEIVRKVEAKNIKFSGLSENKQNALLITSDELPDWMQSLIDTNLRGQYQAHGLIAPFQQKKEWNTRPFVFDLSDDYDTSTFTFSVSGMEHSLSLYPEMKYFPEKANKTKYASSHAPLIAPTSKSLWRFLQGIRGNGRDIHERYMEKSVLCLQSSAYSCGHLSNEEFREISHITSDPYFIVPELIGYFTKNKEKLLETDFQTIFRALLFSHAGRVEDLRSPFLQKFIEEHMEYFYSLGKYQTAAFFLRIAREVSDYAPMAPINERLLDLAREYGNKAVLQREERALLAIEVAAHLSKKETLTIEETGELLRAVTFYKENPLPPGMRDISQERIFQNALIIHGDAIIKALAGESISTIMDPLLQSLYPGVDVDSWDIVSQEPLKIVSSDKRFVCYPCDGEFIDQIELRKIPDYLQNHPIFKRLFPEVKEAILFNKDTYEFTAANGRRTLVFLDQNVLNIEQEYDGCWRRYISESQLLFTRDGDPTAACVSWHLATGYSHWFSPESPDTIFACDTKSGAICYKYSVENASGDFSIKQVTRMRDGARLSTPKDTFTSFETPGYVHEWYKDGDLLEVEFPRFNLQFIRNLEGEFVSEDYPEYHLKVGADFPPLNPLTNALVISKASGENALLVPRQFFKSVGEEHSEVLAPTFDIERNDVIGDATQQSVFFYAIEGSVLQPTSREAGLYLALAYTLIQDYDRASFNLKKQGNSPSKITPREKEILEAISSIGHVTGDSCGNGIALRVQAQLVLLRQKMELPQNLATDYVNYLNHIRHITIGRVTKAEERLIGMAILAQTFDYSVYKRLKSLDPSAVADISLPAPQEKQEIRRRIFGVERELALQPYKSSDEIPDNLPITRSGKSFHAYLYSYFHVALKATAAQRAYLLPRISFMKYGNDGEYRSAGLLLEMVLKSPEKFRANPELDGLAIMWKSMVSHSRERSHWASEMIAIANGLLESEFSASIRPIILDDHCKEEAVQGEIPVQIRDLPEVPLASCDPKEFFESNPTKNVSARHEMAAHSLGFMVDRTENPIAKRAFTGLKNEMVRKSQESPPVEFLPKSTTELKKLAKRLDETAARDSIERDGLEKTVLELANSSDYAQLPLERLGGLRKMLTMENLIIAFGRKDIAPIKHNNPTISDAQCEELLRLVGIYLLHATKIQQIARARGKIDELLAIPEADIAKRVSATGKLIDILASEKRKYDSNKHPIFLVFEYASDKCLYQRQVDLIEKFLISGDDSLIEELCMGSGKSKVLRPLLGMLRADGTSLSMVVIPQSLFEEGATDTYDAMLETLERELIPIHFDRSTPISLLHLETLLGNLLSAIKKRKCIAMASKSVHCLILRFVELNLEHFSGGSTVISQEILCLRKILNLLSISGRPLIDEADSLLNVLHETSFATGDTTPPSETELALITELFSICYTDLDMQKLTSIESDPSARDDAPPFTEVYYLSSIKETLAKKILSRLDSIDFADQDLCEAVKKFTTGGIPDVAIDYVVRKKECVKECQSYFNGLSPDVQDVLALLGEQINNMLPHTLQKVSDESYGLDEEEVGSIAIPYAAVKTPSKGSEFAHPLVTFNLTYQIFMRKGVSSALLDLQIKQIQADVMKELVDEGSLKIEETKGWARLLVLLDGTDFPLFNYKDSHLEALAGHINASSATKLKFVQKVILPQVQLHKASIHSDAHIFAAFFSSITGFTGTLWNSGSMHSKLKTSPSDEISARTLSLLFKEENSNVYIVQASSSPQLLQELAGNKFDLLIDTGGYCKDAENEDVAGLCSEQFDRPVIYYDKKGMQSVTEGSGRKMVFLDQAHTTGADVPQGTDEVGYVTIGDKMLLRDLIQGIWRLRSIEQCQAVHFVISQRVANIICQKHALPEDHKITFEDLILFVSCNQAHEQGEQNYFALLKQISSIPQMILLKALLCDTLSHDKQKELHDRLNKYWVHTLHLPPREQFGQIQVEQPTGDLVERHKVAFLEEIGGIFTAFPELEEIGIHQKTILQEIDELIAHITVALPKATAAKLPGMDSSVEVAQDVDVDTNLNVETDLGKSSGMPLQVKIPYRDLLDAEFSLSIFAKENVSRFSLESYLKAVPDLERFATAFSGIDLTTNVLQWTKDVPDTIEDVALFGENRTQIQYLIFKDGRALICSLNEAGGGINQLRDIPRYHIELGLVLDRFKTSEQLDPKYAPQNAEDNLKIVKLKFLAGYADYSKVEIALLRDWFLEVSPKDMEWLYTHRILSGFPRKMAKFQQSSLHKLFKELAL